jgi:AraC-like DNA-binding protein
MVQNAEEDELPGIVAPDAHVEFIFQTGSPCGTCVGRGGPFRPSPRAMLYAQRHGTLALAPTGENVMIAFRTAPVVASAIIGRTLADCWDRPVPLADLIGAEADRLVEQIEGRPAELQSALLESWLIGRLAPWGAEHERNLRLQRALLWRSAAEPLSALADRIGVTSRTLRRHFARHAGLTPKQLSMSGRILRACADLSDRRHMPIAHVALRVGFADQAAFTNAFRHYVGMSPGQLRAEALVYCERPGG